MSRCSPNVWDGDQRLGPKLSLATVSKNKILALKPASLNRLDGDPPLLLASVSCLVFVFGLCVWEGGGGGGG